MTSGSATWAPLSSAKATVAWTRTWRMLTYESADTPGARLYLALAPESLTQGYGAVFPLLDSQSINHRHARSPEALQKVESHPGWAGKAVVIDTDAHTDAEELAAELDARLADLGLLGPSVLNGARPVGGKSGLLFIRRTTGSAEIEDRRKRLEKLLGD